MKKFLKIVTLVIICSLIINLNENKGIAKKVSNNSNIITIINKTNTLKKLVTTSSSVTTDSAIDNNTENSTGLDSGKKTKIKIKSINISKRYIMLRVGEKVKLDINLKPKKATLSDIRFKAGKHNKSKYISINKEGIIIAKKSGVGKNVNVYVCAKKNKKKKSMVILKILPKINPKKKMIALTFDDGPNVTSNASIVKTLAKNNCTATFFVLGCLLGRADNRNEIRYMAKEGMEIGSHTQNHLKLTSLSTPQLKSEIHQTDNMLKSLLGQDVEIMRAPYGACDANVLKQATHPMIQWSLDTLDWKTRNATTTYAAVLNRAQDGSIVLMHSIYDPTAQAVSTMVPALKKRGFQLVTVSELFKYKHKSLKKGQIYCNP